MATREKFVNQADGAGLARLDLLTPEVFFSSTRVDATLQSNGLTANEVRLLTFLAAGWSSIQIGRHNCRSEKTVRNQLTCIYNKLGAANRAEAVAKFLRRG